MIDRTAEVLRDIAHERAKQDIKWGVQEHQDVPVDASPVGIIVSKEGGAVAYAFPNSAVARDACDSAARAGCVSWFHIAVEELAEAVDARDAASRRDELVQLAAVIVAWIENVDRSAS